MKTNRENVSSPDSSDIRGSNEETNPNGFDKVWNSVRSFIDENVTTNAGAIQFHQGSEDQGLVLILIKQRGGLRGAGT